MSPSKPWKRQCRGTRADGERCTRWAIVGGDVCPKHGAGAPQVKAAARRRVQLAEVEAEVSRLAIEVDTDPAAGLLMAVRRAAGAVYFLGQQVNLLASITQLDSVPGGGTVERLAVTAEEYRLWCDRLATYSASALRVGIDDRRVQLEERQVEILVQFVRDLIAAPELGLDSDRQMVGLEVAGRLMRALPAA